MSTKELKAAGFAPVTRCPRRLIASIQGQDKSGKMHLALTGRKPTGLISIEIGGDEGVVDQFIPEGQNSTENIQIVKIRMEDPMYPNRADFPSGTGGDKEYDTAVTAAVQEAAAAAMDKFYAAYYVSLSNFAVTIVDTGSDLWELIRLSNFGRLEKIPQLAYTQLNKTMDKLIEDAFGYNGSVFFTHHMTEKWETFVNDKGKEQGRPSGVFEQAGYKGMKKKVQAVIELWREDLAEADPVSGRLIKFHAQIINSRHNPDAMGKQFSDYDINIPTIGCAIIDGSKRTDWE